MMNSVEDNDPEQTDQPYGGQEKRITFQLYDYWFGLSDNGAIPSLKALKPDDIATFRNNMVLIDLRDGQGEALLQVIGHDLLADLESDLTGAPVSAIPRRTLLSRITDHYMEVLGNKAPISFDAEFDSKSQGKILYRGILLPFSDDGERINFILGGIRWITEEEKAEQSKGEGDPLIEDNEASPTVLQDSLKQCRKIIQGQNPAQQRSRKSLYLALGAILDFYALCQANPDSYKELLQAEGLKAQKRAPFTPILKLCFGRDYDKTRLTEYASALSYAHKNGQDGQSLPDYLDNFPGGIKGCVRARRGGEDVGTENNKEIPKKNILQAINEMPALAQFDLDGNVMADDGICVMLARKDGTHMDIVDILPGKDKNVTRIMTQMIKKSQSTIE